MTPVARPGCPSRNGRHDTAGAYTMGCRCPAACLAQRRYRKHHDAGLLPPAWVDSTGTIRRLQALAAIGQGTSDTATGLGWSQTLLAATRGAHRRGIARVKAEHVAVYYERHCMHVGDDHRLQTHARRVGWTPPMGWEGVDIDDPAATPVVDLEDSGAVDEVAIERVCAGKAPLWSLPAEHHPLVVARLTGAGMTYQGIADHVGSCFRRIRRLHTENCSDDDSRRSPADVGTEEAA